MAECLAPPEGSAPLSSAILNRFKALRHATSARHAADTDEGRAQMREMRVVLAAAAAALAKFISILTMFVTVPITLHYLGNERYGMWMTISSLAAYLAFADFGLGSGLMSAIAKASGRDDNEAMKELVSAGFVSLGALGVVVALAAVLIVPLFDWAAIFSVSTPLAQQEAPTTASVFVGVYALAMPMTIVQRVQLGIQQGFQSQLGNACRASLQCSRCSLLFIAMPACPCSFSPFQASQL